MRIEVRCYKCGKVLETTTDLSNSLVDIILKVEPCPDLDCRDCSSCDDTHRSKVQDEREIQAIKERGPR